MSLFEKRAKYQRSQTLSILPTNKKNPCKADSDSSISLEKMLKLSTALPQATKGTDSKVETSLSTKSPEIRTPKTFCRHSNESIKLPQKWINSSINQGGKTRPKSFTRKISCNDFQQSTSLINCTKASNGSANILNRVKEKIVETVYHTQDMPHWAAIVQEKRQKAADEYEAKIVGSLNREKLIENHNENVRNSRGFNLNSPSQVVEPSSQRDKNIIAKREKARQGFRRRSISQDSYPQNLLLPKAGPLVAKKSNEGITCSSGDFQAILHEFNQYLKESKVASKNSSIASGSSKYEDQMTLNLMTSSETPTNIACESLASPKVKSTHEKSLYSKDIHLPHHNEFSLARIAEMDYTARNSFDAVEVEYDENGQTWGVYGAEIDPEILGNAIQIHLQRIIEQKKKKNNNEDLSFATSKSHRKNIKKRDTKQLKTPERSCFVTKFFCFIKRNSCEMNTVEE